jgi:hypothetical protein
MTNQPNTEVLPLIETVKSENQQKNHLSKNWWRFDRNLQQNAPSGMKIKNQRLSRKIYPMPLTCLIS